MSRSQEAVDLCFWNPPSYLICHLQLTQGHFHFLPPNRKKNKFPAGKKKTDFHGGSPEAAFSLLQQLGAVPPFAAGSPPPVPSFFKAQKTGPN